MFAKDKERMRFFVNVQSCVVFNVDFFGAKFKINT